MILNGPLKNVFLISFLNSLKKWRATNRQEKYMRTHVRTKTLSITSGKGGVGKSTITSNVAVSLAQAGKKVLILDGDLGMGNIDIMFGIRSTKTILDVLNGDC